MIGLESGTVPHEERGGDAAAYALGALQADEAVDFELHLEQCHLCAEDLAGFKPVVDQLAMSAPQYHVPSGLRRRVMGNVRPKRAFAFRVWPRRTTFATAMAIGVAAAVLAIGSLVSGGSGGVRVLNARVLDSPGSAQVRLAGGRAELIVRHFPAPTAGHIYEVWLKRPGRAPAPTTVLFSVSTQGAADIGVPRDLNGVEELFVTEEPAGGSVTTTHQPVIVGPLS